MTEPKRGDRPTPPAPPAGAPAAPLAGPLSGPLAGPSREALAVVRRALDEAESRDSVGALPYLREAADRLTEILDEAMAAAVLTGQASLRGAGAQAGLTENAVGPRLARTRSLAAYADDRGRVTAAGVERAKYDLETGQPRQPAAAPAPMRFKPRRSQ